MINAVSPATDLAENQKKTISYPILLLRIQALMLDTVMGILLILAAVMAVIGFDIEDTSVKTALVLGPLLLFEPLMIRLTGGSLGHHYAGVRIIDGKTGKNLAFINGVVRLILKWMLGILSWFTMLITRRHQAIHDFLSGSVVVFKDESKVSPLYKLKPRPFRREGGRIPLFRRVAAVLGYSALALLVVGVVGSAAISDSCALHDVCTDAENTRIFALSMGLWVGFVLIAIAGFAGWLPGASKRR